MSGKKKGKYFPNNARALQQVPAENFDTCSYEDFVEWRLCSWEMPESVACIIREERKDGTIKEHVYQKGAYAKKKLIEIVSNNNTAILADHDSVNIIYGANTDDED